MPKTNEKTQRAKIIKGMDMVYEKLIAYKKKNKSKLVVLKGDKIVKIKP